MRSRILLLILLALVAVLTISPSPAVASDTTSAPTPAIYDTLANTAEQLADAVALAHETNRHVLIQWGANWCVWCRLLHGMIGSDSSLLATVNTNYVWVMADVGVKGKNTDLLAKYGVKREDGIPFLTVLDGNGNLVANQETGSLETGDKEIKGHDRMKVLSFLTSHAPTVGAVSSPEEWQSAFAMEDCEFTTVGRNDYFILEPGYQLVLAGIDDGDSAALVITVLNETITIDGVETRIVEERESVGGELIEVSRNFYAFCQKTGDIFYFGEDVDMYADGKVTAHGGAWRAGTDNARAGIMIPGGVKVGDAFYQEIAPGVAMDRARIVSATHSFHCPAGEFSNCLLVEETTPLEPDVAEAKIHAPGVGLVKDGPLVLVRHGRGTGSKD